MVMGVETLTQTHPPFSTRLYIQTPQHPPLTSYQTLEHSSTPHPITPCLKQTPISHNMRCCANNVRDTTF